MIGRRRLRLAIAATVVLALAGTAAADDDGFLGKPRPKLAIEDCPVPPPLDATAQEDLAYEHYRRGDTLYTQGDYEGAIAEFVASHCLAPDRSSILVDIAQAHERMFQYELVVAYLERFVRETTDATKRSNASGRIQVLSNLRSQIKVATEPAGAVVTVASDDGVGGTERANSDRAITVVAGDYQMTVEAPGFEPIRRSISVGIGKPYSFSYRLTPRRGRVRIQAVPGDARILIDDRLVGLGSFDGPVDLGVHTIAVDAGGYTSKQTSIEVVEGALASTSIELTRPSESGRWLMIIGTTVLGGYAGTVSGLLTEKDATTDKARYAAGAGLGLGLAAGAIGGYIVVPGDIGHGTSSFILTSAAAGIVNGTVLGSFSNDDQVVSTISLGGAAIGAGTAAILLQRFDVTDGQAALYNSGLVWGAVSGTLFAAIFEGDEPGRTGRALTLAGTNLGLVTGAVLANRYQVSRRRVIYIDLAGAAGLVAGLALQNAASAASGADDSSIESRSHFTLAGMAVGLGVGTFLTRNLDAPRLSPTFRPAVTPVRDAAGGQALTFGFAGDL